MPSQYSDVPGSSPTGFWGGLGEGYIPNSSPNVYAPSFKMPYYQENRQNLQNQQNYYQNRGPSAFRSDQEGLIRMLQEQSQGQGPSVAQDQLKMGTDRAIKQQMAAAASQAGYQPQAALQRQIANQGAESMQNLAAESGMLRAQEMLAARQQLAAAIEQARAQDQQLQQMNDAMVQNFVAQGLNLDQAQLQANMALQELIAGGAANVMNASTARRGQDKSFLGGLIGGLFSDKRLKKEVVESEIDMHSFLEAIGG
mgnify:CR=1 FL=1